MESTYGGAAKQRALFVSFDGNFHGDLVCEYHETFLLDSEISLLRFMLFREGIKKKKKKILPHKSLLYLCTSFSTPQQRSPNRPLRYHSLFRHFSNYQDFLILLVVISTRL